MKKRFNLYISAILIIVISFTMFLISCSPALSFSGKALADGTVGVEYSAFLGVDGGEESVSYALKEGSVLPSGLIMNQEGFVEGIPLKKTTSANEFIVVATTEKKTTEANFTIQIGEGTISYTGGEIKIAAGVEFEKNDLTTAVGAVGIVYTLKSGTLPKGVELSSNGVLTGAIADISETTITLAASAEDCKGAEASFTLKAVQPWIDYEKAALANATANSFYTGSVASAVGATDITYALKEGDTLPEGLALNSIGLIHGTPTTAKVQAFTIIASSKNYTSAELEFKLQVRPAKSVSTAAGKIVFSDKTELSEKTFIQGRICIEIGEISASATNRNIVSYSITGGSIHSGLTFYSNGAIVGKITKSGEKTFTVKASASDCEDVTKEFTMTAVNPILTYSGKDFYVGETCSINLASAVLPDGSVNGITYEIKSGLPEGLSLSSDGILSGTPLKSYEAKQVVITASAEGYTSKGATFTFHIEDAIVEHVSLFEAEHTDLRGVSGAGYSSSAAGAAMIQTMEGVSASANGTVVDGGYFVGYTFKALTITYVINSSKAVSGASLSLGLDSEIGGITLSASTFDVQANGVSINYSAAITGSGERKFTAFKNYAIAKINLVEGKNIITLSVRTNTLSNGSTGGPGIDYLQLENLGGANLSWRPSLYNMSGK